ACMCVSFLYDIISLSLSLSLSLSSSLSLPLFLSLCLSLSLSFPSPPLQSSLRQVGRLLCVSECVCVCVSVCVSVSMFVQDGGERKSEDREREGEEVSKRRGIA